MHMADFLSEHNLLFKLMDHFSDLLPKLCPDSKIAVQFKCKCEEAKDVSFSVIIDETTDVSTHKELAIVTRVFSGKSVECVLYRLVEVSSCDA